MLRKILSVLVILSVGMILFGNFSVGISSIVEHPSLNAIRDGIIDYLKSSELANEIEIDFKCAQGDMKIAKSIADQFVSDNVDLIIGISTPVAQACAAATKEIPVLFSAVTDPIGAGLVANMGLNESNISGISDLTPVVSQFQLLKLCFPETKKVGFIFNPSEANSVTILDLAKQAAEQLGMEIIEILGTTTTEMITSLNATVGDIDAIYIGNDNTAASSISSLGSIAEKNAKPIIAAFFDEGVLIGFGFDYYEVGLRTGEQALEILNGVNIAQIPSKILPAEVLELYIDIDLANVMELEIPEAVIEKADMIIENGEEIYINN